VCRLVRSANLRNVINVIKDQSERAETLDRTWALARHVLVVSTKVRVDHTAKLTYPSGVSFTARGAFQRMFNLGALIGEWSDWTSRGTTHAPAAIAQRV
jgi:hypothetical protein